MKFIKDLVKGEKGSEIYLIKTSIKKEASNGRVFVSLVLQDKTGTISAKKWNASDEDIEALKSGNFIDVTYDIGEYMEKLDMKILSYQVVEVKKLDDYIQTGVYSQDDLTNELELFLSQIKNPSIKLIVDTLYNENKEKFLEYPAASSNHHAFKNGLLTHTVSMFQLADKIISHYGDLDRDVLYGAIFMHDYGKIYELSGYLGTEYTVEGRLIGHIILAVNAINSVAEKNNLKHDGKVLLLEHAVLASHGKYEFGSPVLGMTKEAIVVNFLDDLDAKMMMCSNVMDEIKEEEFSRPILSLENRRLYKSKK